MSGEYALPVLLQQELARTEADLAVAVAEAQRARATIRRIEALHVRTRDDGSRYIAADDLFAALYPERQQ